jgi:hypothetical protein
MKFRSSKSFIAPAVAIFSAIGAASNTEAALVAYWNFNNLATPSATSGTGSLGVSQGVGSLTWSGNSTNLVYFGGTVTNMQVGDDRGLAVALQNGLAGENNGDHLEFKISLVDLEDLSVSFAGQRTSTGFTAIDVSWAVGTGAFTTIATVNDLPSSMGTTTAVPAAIRTVDFSSVSDEIAGESDVRIRMTFSGGSTTAASGNVRLDNVTFIAVPEPTSALLGGLGFVALLRRRRY